MSRIGTSLLTVWIILVTGWVVIRQIREAQMVPGSPISVVQAQPASPPLPIQSRVQTPNRTVVVTTSTPVATVSPKTSKSHASVVFPEVEPARGPAVQNLSDYESNRGPAPTPDAPVHPCVGKWVNEMGGLEAGFEIRANGVWRQIPINIYGHWTDTGFSKNNRRSIKMTADTNQDLRMRETGYFAEADQDRDCLRISTASDPNEYINLPRARQ